MANTISQPHWPRAGSSRSRRMAATANAKAQPANPQAVRMAKGGSSVSRNLVCGQLSPQLHAVNRTRAMPSARVPRKRRAAGSAYVDTNLRVGQGGVHPDAEM